MMRYNPPTLMALSKAGDLNKVMRFSKKQINVVHDGYTALILATMYGHTEVVRYLCHKGADVNAKDLYGNSALAFAAADGNMEILNILCDWGADLYSKDDTGTTPLTVAAINYEPEAVIQLCKWM